MGKSRRNRTRAPRSDPISKPVKPPSDPELAALRESRILPVIKDLQSADIKSRTAAASAIANIVTDTKCRKLLLREQIVHIVLTETLTDASIDSRAAGWEILKVISQEEEADFCVHLYRLDILTAIEHAAKAIVETIVATEPAFSKLMKAQQRLLWDMTDSLLSLLGSLAVAREEIVQSIVANQTIMRFLFRLVAADVVPQDIFEETLSCLMTLSEENLLLGQAIIDDQETRCYDELLKWKSKSGSRSVLACGVLHNVFASLQWLDHSPGKDGACDAILIPDLCTALEQPFTSNTKADEHNGYSPFQTAQTALEVLASIGTDFQSTLEKGNRPQPGGPKATPAEEWNGFGDDGDEMEVDGASNHGEDDEDEELEGAGEDGGEEEDDDEFDEEDLERVTGLDSDREETHDLEDLPTLRALIQKAVPQLIRLTNIATDSDEALAIQDHALSALNNIAWTVSCIEFANGENANIYAAWAPAAKKIWLKSVTPVVEADNDDLNLATQVTSLAWAVSRTLSGKTPASETQHRSFMALYQATKGLYQAELKSGNGQESGAEDPFQGVGIKCIGVLGSLARDPAPIKVNREIGVFLLTLLNTPDTAPAEIIEALNQLFDIYGDEDFACDKEVFWKDGFLRHLEELLPKLKTIAKGIDKRAHEELRTKADEAVLNLGRFIQYKKKHSP
ncbi:synchronized import protein 1 [Naviculisporaceae sp. PSN 640]